MTVEARLLGYSVLNAISSEGLGSISNPESLRFLYPSVLLVNKLRHYHTMLLWHLFLSVIGTVIVCSL